MIKKFCKKCGCELSCKCKGEYCNHHRNRTGINNSFFGKTHTKDVIDAIKKTTSIKTKELWTNQEYRDKVVNNATGLKRTDDFKKIQSKNALKQFKDNSQRQSRSERMKRSWKEETITINIHSINESKQEKELRQLLIDKLKGTSDVVKKKTIKINSKWYYPDIIINNLYIVEYNGNFWHANPNRYKAEDIIHHNFSANDIWVKDKQRIEDFNNAGYKSLIIWEDEFKSDKEKTVDKILKWLKEQNNESRV